MMRKTLILALTLLIMAPDLLTAQEKRGPLKIIAVNITARSDDRPRDGNKALPGDTIEFQLRFTNITGGVVKNVVFEDPIPKGLVYLPESAGANRDDVEVLFSIDGGKTFHPTPMIEVEEDGKKVKKPAPPEAYTNVRWVVRNEIRSAASVTAFFRTRVGQ